MNSNKPKVLIWDLGINLKNSGGPAGYLYNWKEYLSNHHNYDNIFYVLVKCSKYGCIAFIEYI